MPKTVDPKAPYTGPLADTPAVWLQSGPAGVRVQTAETIPQLALIQEIITAALCVMWELRPAVCAEGGVEGVVGPQHTEELEEPSYTELRWVGDSYEIMLLSDNSVDPSQADEIVAGHLYVLLERALFVEPERDSNGYPRLLSTRDPEEVMHIILEHFRLSYGGQRHQKLVEYLRSPQASNRRLAALIG